MNIVKNISIRHPKRRRVISEENSLVDCIIKKLNELDSTDRLKLSCEIEGETYVGVPPCHISSLDLWVHCLDIRQITDTIQQHYNEQVPIKTYEDIFSDFNLKPGQCKIQSFYINLTECNDAEPVFFLTF